MSGQSFICPKCGNVWYEMDIAKKEDKGIQCPYCGALFKVRKKPEDSLNLNP